MGIGIMVSMQKPCLWVLGGMIDWTNAGVCWAKVEGLVCWRKDA